MAKKEAIWECLNGDCLKENKISYNPQELKERYFACWNCGKVHGSFTVDEEDSNWLSCIEYKGIGAKTPTGYKYDKGTKQTIYTNPNGEGYLDRPEYAALTGWDPKTLYCNVHPENEICKDPEKEKNKSSIDLGDLTKLIDKYDPQVDIK
jgi:hypothetical protein